jgi:hypothetical protein
VLPHICTGQLQSWDPLTHKQKGNCGDFVLRMFFNSECGTKYFSTAFYTYTLVNIDISSCRTKWNVKSWLLCPVLHYPEHMVGDVTMEWCSISLQSYYIISYKDFWQVICPYINCCCIYDPSHKARVILQRTVYIRPYNLSRIFITNS